MRSFPSFVPKPGILRLTMLATFTFATLRVAALLLVAAALLLTDAAGSAIPQAGAASSQEPSSADAQAPVPKYDKAIFLTPIPSDQLSFLNQFAGVPTKKVVRDKQYLKLMHTVLPVCIFHYGWDMPPFDALKRVFSDSTQPVQIRDGRYFVVSSRSGPYLQGRGMMWIDMQQGIALAAFYFYPTNGEPTPTVTVFSNQLKEESFRLSQLPPEFVEALSLWSVESGVPDITTRYFIGDSNKKILLEHDEDYCVPGNPITGSHVKSCEQMNADSADIDLNAAYYLDQTSHATNATAWMIVSPDQVAWIELRDNTCRIRPDLLGCRIRLTRERTHIILTRPPGTHPPVPRPPHK